MFCKHPLTVKLKSGQYGSVPCGWCINCRISHSQVWSDRIEMEIKESGGRFLFFTLTYDDDHVRFTPHGLMTLRPDDHKLFMKRLRIGLQRKGYLKPFKFFMCGEYGDRFGRPHMHYLLIGYSVDPNIKAVITRSWPYGLVDIQSPLPTGGCISYVTKYILKRYRGKTALDVYDDALPPFQRSSKGLGKHYYLSHLKEIDNEELFIRGRPLKVPMSYIDYFPKLKAKIVVNNIDRNLNPSHNSSVKEYLTLRQAQLKASERETLLKLKDQRGL